MVSLLVIGFLDFSSHKVGNHFSYDCILTLLLLGFLTSVLQYHSRKYNTPIDILSFDFEVVDEEPETLGTSPAEVCN